MQAARKAGHEVGALSARLSDRDAMCAQLHAYRPDAVVHLAAVSASNADQTAYYDVNVVGTVNLLDAICELPQTPAKVLLVSSANVYGRCGTEAIDERCAPAPIDHYGMSKLAMEILARSYQPHLPIVVCRPFNYTGVGQRSPFVIAKLIALFAKRVPLMELGSLDVAREFIDVRFVCAAMLALLSAGEAGATYNICRGSTVTLRDVVNLLTELTGHVPQLASSAELVRRNDIACLRGDPSLLLATIGTPSAPTLAETLRWMLDAAGENAGDAAGDPA